MNNIRVGQIGHVCRRRIWIIGRLPDIIHIPVTRTHNLLIDVFVADVIRVGAVTISACLCAFLNSRETFVLVSVQEAGTLGGINELLVRVVVGEVDIGLFLDCRVEPAVVHAEGDQVDAFACNGSGLDGGVLLLDVRGEFRPIVSAV